MRIDDHYAEIATLHAGDEVHLRTIRPSDKALLAEGFARLGPESRYRRFFTSKRSLTDADLAYLTELDGWNHVAIGAARTDAAGVEQGVAVARFVRCEDDPHAAEPAVAVADDMQGKGLGSLMLRRLTEAALERDVRRFRCPVLATNDAMRHLLEQIGADEVITRPFGDGAVELEIALPGAAPDTVPPAVDVPEAERSGTEWLLSAVARRLVSVPLRWPRRH